MDSRLLRRRRLLVAAAGGASALAGCSSDVIADGESGPNGREPGRRDDTEAGTVTPPTTSVDSVQVFVDTQTGQRQLLFDADDVAVVGVVQERQGAYQVPIELTDDGTQTVRSRLREADALDQPDQAAIQISVDGETVQELSISPGLAEAINSGEWRGEFLLSFEDRETARQVRAYLASHDQ